MKLIKNILLIVMICCGIVLSLIINITIYSIVYPKTFFITIFDFIEIILVLTQNPINWILLIIIIICLLIMGNLKNN